MLGAQIPGKMELLLRAQARKTFIEVRMVATVSDDFKVMGNSFHIF